MFFQKNARFTCVCALFLLTLQAIRDVITSAIGGISTSVVHRLPKPRRRVRFPYAALRRNSLVAIKSLGDLGRPQLLLLPRAHEALGRMLGIRSGASRFARGAWGMSLREVKAATQRCMVKTLHPPKAHNLGVADTTSRSDTTCAKRTQPRRSRHNVSEANIKQK